MFPFDGRYQPWRASLGFAIAVGLAYFVAAELGQALRVNTGISVFWPAAGISVGALIVWGPATRIPVAAGVIVATIVSNLTIGRSPWLAVAFSVVNAGQALLTSAMIERWLGRTVNLGDVSQVIWFLVASTIGSAVAATGAATAVGLIQQTASLSIVWRVWFASCLLGIVTVAPLLVGIAATIRQPPQRRVQMEGAVGIVTLAAMCAFVISLPQGPWSTALPLALVFPILLWVAVRSRPVFSAAAALVVSQAVIWSITFSRGHFGDANIPLTDRILAAQTVVLTGVVLSLVLAALFAERRRSEVVLERSKQRLQLALDGAELGAFSADLVTGRFDCDARTALIHGHNLRPTTLKESRRFVHPNDRVRIDAAFIESRGAGGSWNAEYRVIPPAGHCRDGETLWVAVEGSFVRDPSGTPVGLLGVTRDITDRKETERALAERNLQLELAGKSGRVGSYTYDVGSDLMQVSEGYVAVHGLPEGTTETTRSEWKARTLPDDLPRVEQMREQAFRERLGEYGIEYRIVCPTGGEVRWVESRSFISYDADGRPQRLVGVNIDITERKKATQVAQRLASIVESSDDAIISKDLNGVIVTWNRGAEQLFGFSAEEAIGKSILFLIPPDRQHEGRTILERVRFGERINHYETVRRCKNGRSVDVSLTISPLLDAAGMVVGASKIARDISSRKRAEEQRRMLNAEVDHRAKNVLATVHAIINQTQEASSSYADFIVGLDRRIGSLARTHELLSESGWRGGELAEIVRREFAPYAAGNIDIGGPCVTLRADATQSVAMTLHELTTNAAKYGALCTPGGRLALHWSWISNGSTLRLAIEWQEVNGPPVAAPSRLGYGTSTVRELIPFELGGTVDLTFAADGVRCRIEIPATWIHQGKEENREAQQVQLATDDVSRLE